MTASAIGIDLGTSYSCVGVGLHGKVEIIPNDHGDRTTPTYVAFTENRRLFAIEDTAKSQIAINPENTVFNAKRVIGHMWNDGVIQIDRKLWPFEVVNDLEGGRG